MRMLYEFVSLFLDHTHIYIYIKYIMSLINRMILNYFLKIKIIWGKSKKNAAKLENNSNTESNTDNNHSCFKGTLKIDLLP